MANIILWQCYNSDTSPVRTLGAYQLASWLRQHGYTVKVIDFCHLMTTDQLVDITDAHVDKSTLAVGVSSTFWHEEFSKPEFKTHREEPQWVVDARDVIERRYPSLYWLLGGSKSHHNNLVKTWIKFSGHAEDSLLKWVDQNSNRYVRRELYNVQTFTRSFSKDDFIRRTEVLPMDLGRGCMFKCKFCSYPLIGKKPGTYLRNFDQVREEMIFNYNEFGVTKYYYQDDTVNESIEKVEALADLAWSLPFRLEWVGYCRADLIDKRPAMVDLLKESGMRSCHFGIESFTRSAALAVGKGWSAVRGKQFLLELQDKWKQDVNWAMSMIVGLPGETEDDLDSTLKWCLDNNMSDVRFFDLGLDSSSDKRWKSEFEIEHEKYGFRFPDPTRPMYWESDEWTSASAAKVAERLRSTGRPHWRPAGWYLPPLSFTGESLSFLAKQRYSDLNWKGYKSRTKLFVDEYVAFQLK